VRINRRFNPESFRDSWSSNGAEQLAQLSEEYSRAARAE